MLACMLHGQLTATNVLVVRHGPIQLSGVDEAMLWQDAGAGGPGCLHLTRPCRGTCLQTVVPPSRYQTPCPTHRCTTQVSASFAGRGGGLYTLQSDLMPACYKGSPHGGAAHAVRRTGGGCVLCCQCIS